MLAYNYSCYHFTEWVQYGQITNTQFIIVAILNGVTILPAIVLNALILISIWRTPALHKPSTVFLFNLALSDFVVGLVVQPVLMAWFVLELNAVEIQATYCYMALTMIVSSTFFSCLSFYMVTVVAVDRFLALYLHLRYPTIVTMKRAILVAVSIWLTALSVVVIWFFFGTKYKRVFSILSKSNTAILCSIVFISYFKIYRIVKKHQRHIQAADMSLTRTFSVTEACSLEGSASDSPNTQPQSIRRYKKSLISSFYVYFAFVICYLPILCSVSYDALTNDHRVSAYFTKIALCVLAINSALNPAIYFWKMRELRNAVWGTVNWLREMVGVRRNEVNPSRTAQVAWVVK
ncbi:melanocyte-stimulating hormone receptor [Nematostella vectensis]|uniref:melanocyte-stimulating hormone receptor n=1 Tax=Nematostella vectensis TaxID=45351 RepID=UPI00207795DC|nr:melanocyte-stimulating hormone receptor [Nematostella vectensis]